MEITDCKGYFKNGNNCFYKGKYGGYCGIHKNEQNKNEKFKTLNLIEMIEKEFKKASNEYINRVYNDEEIDLKTNNKLITGLINTNEFLSFFINGERFDLRHYNDHNKTVINLNEIKDLINDNNDNNDKKHINFESEKVEFTLFNKNHGHYLSPQSLLNLDEIENGGIIFKNRFNNEKYYVSNFDKVKNNLLIMNKLNHIEDDDIINFKNKHNENFVAMKKKYFEFMEDMADKQYTNYLIKDKKSKNNKLNTIIKKLNNEIKNLKYKEEKQKKLLNKLLIENKKLTDENKNLKSQLVNDRINETLHLYEIYDNFINRECERITGKARNYNTLTYNKLSDFLKLKSSKQSIKLNLGCELYEFITAFNILKNERNNTAHPKINLRNQKIENVIKNHIKEVVKRNYK